MPEASRTPSQIYLLDPRLVGAEAILRVLEALAVQDYKALKQNKKFGAASLAVPLWARGCATSSQRVVFESIASVVWTPQSSPLLQLESITLMGLCQPNILPNLLSAACGNRAQLISVKEQARHCICTIMVQQQTTRNEAPVQTSLKLAVTSGARPLSTAEQAMPYPAQQYAIVSSLLRPLTLIVGPPGTGKTDTVGWSLVLLCENLCHSKHSVKNQIMLLCPLKQSFGSNGIEATFAL